ncbi:phage tail protein [Kordia sp.]|uniref:phage tail protein n=1 Tax=Kordia sp. TaxID=1965332 RepID=UPI003D2B9CB3
MKQSLQTLKSYFQGMEVEYMNLLDSLAMPMIGEIKTVSFAAVPSGWAKCDGQLLQISSNSILYGLIGTTYGGDGITTFALPDLRDRVTLHNGQTTNLGQIGGEAQNTLSESQLPSHSHAVGNLATSNTLTGTVMANEDDGESNEPAGKNFGLIDSSSSVNIDTLSYNSVSNDRLMAADNVQINGNVTLSGNTATTGSATPVNNMQPYLVVNTIIALEGIDPLAS